VIVPPNAIFIGLSLFLGVERPLINFDYVVAAMLFPLVGWIAGALVLFFAFVFDGVAIVGQVLPFNRITDFFYFLPYWKHSPQTYQIFIISIFILYLGTTFLFKSILRKFDISFLAIFNFLLFAFIADVLLFPTANNWVWRVKDSNIVDSQVLFNFDARDRAFFGFFDSEGDPFSEGEYKGLMSSLVLEKGGSSKNFILVLNESWGASIDPALNYALMSPLLKEVENRGGVYEVGQVDAEGPTIKGEFRELCDKELLHINIRDLGSRADSCLPNQLRKKGFRTISVHPASGLMYDRAFWYPFVGFEESIFFETVRWNSRCYSFPGGCDVEVPGKVRAFFGQDDQIFLYWLTLNTHSVYDERDIVFSDFECSEWQVDEQSSLCRYLRLQSQFFSTLAEMAAWPEISGSEFLIIGDHAPPILEPQYRGKFIDEREVAWIRFSIP